MRRILVLTVLLLAALANLAGAATITIVNNDGAGEGFNDPTVVAPVGGNPGTTLGQQRLNVFQHAANIWGALLPSTVTIVVRAQFDPQTCTATSAVLGSAGALTVHRNFSGAPLANTWYCAALANKFAGVDLSANPDINATFNSNLNGNPACLGGTGWYLGYDGNEGSNIELLPVVLHELGHGLGFQTFVNGTSGAEFGGATPSPDRFEQFIRDNTLGLTWDQMTAGQRVTSAVSNNIVWNGNCVTTQAPYVLDNAYSMTVNAGGPLPATTVVNVASFGPQSFSLTGDVILIDDGAAPNSDGCTAPVNAIAGKIVLIDRGVCAFTAKAAFAQAAGAIGVIIANNTANPLAAGGTDPSIVIPVVGISLTEGNALKAALLNGTVNVSIGVDMTLLAGADAANRVKLYAPNPLSSGSSISHFDVSAFPHLLMEPAINTSLSNTVDLTLRLFADMGWLACESPVAVAISSFDASVADNGVRLRARFFSTLMDAAFVYVYRADGSGDDFRRISAVDAPRDGDFAFIDTEVLPGSSYRYKIGVVDGDGEFFSQTAEVRLPGKAITLSQNMPNPFNPTTTIRFSLPASERVALGIYAPNGALVRMLVDDVRQRGDHSVTWDGRDNRGTAVASGVYFYRLTAGKFSDTRRMVLLK